MKDGADDALDRLQTFQRLFFDDSHRDRPKAKLSRTEYLKQANPYFSCEIADVLLPQVLEWVGEKQLVFGPTCRMAITRGLGGELAKRKDISQSAVTAILETTPVRLYGLSDL